MRVSREGKRGCGYRKGGGLYLVSDGPGEDCAKLPVRLDVCPTCGHGIKPSRGWTWIEPNEIVEPEPHGSAQHSEWCPLSTGFDGKAGLIWIGDAYYSPTSFVREAHSMGISRRISTVPRDFEVGKTWVLLAHRKAEWKPCPECGDGVPEADCPECEGEGKVPVAAIFYLFRPERIEYVVKGDESDEDLERLEKRGIEPVKVIPVEDQQSLEVEA